MKKFGFVILVMSIAIQTYAIDGILIKTIDYSFKEKWSNTVGSSIPIISTCNTVYKKQYFFITTVASDYALNNQDIANVLYSIKITKPDNSIYFSQENLPLINGKISNKNNFQMSDAILKICFEDNDAFGKYKIEVLINDIISGKSKSINSEITLAPLPPYNSIQIKNDENFSEWFTNYYKNPSPEQAIAYYTYYSQSKFSEKESTFLPVISVFLEIVKNNNFLLPQILDCYKQEDLKTKIYLLYLLTYSDLGAKDFFESLVDKEKEVYDGIKNVPLIDIYGTISNPAQLDMLWGTFMASGSYMPILKLIQTLDYTKYQGYLDAFSESEQTDEDRQNAINNAIYDSLVWSLRSNCEQHRLVKDYCYWAVNYENLSVEQKDELNKILKSFK